MRLNLPPLLLLMFLCLATISMNPLLCPPPPIPPNGESLLLSGVIYTPSVWQFQMAWLAMSSFLTSPYPPPQHEPSFSTSLPSTHLGTLAAHSLLHLSSGRCLPPSAKLRL